MLDSTYSPKLVGTEKSPSGNFARELFQATPLFVFYTGVKAALAASKQQS
jgi:hypothetical protein